MKINFTVPTLTEKHSDMTLKHIVKFERFTSVTSCACDLRSAGPCPSHPAWRSPASAAPGSGPDHSQSAGSSSAEIGLLPQPTPTSIHTHQNPEFIPQRK
jgi:hypothetical protein